ncbi:integrin beta-5 isoform X2 [Heterodontus francisci]|uniref:integrin beta-5 isoform X2 n=1 Tax=Heterodontus francisci TaxID=7792 RepID=UPI00355B0752
MQKAMFKKRILNCLLLSYPVFYLSMQNVSGLNICTSGRATSCKECLLIHPDCAWCVKEEFGNKGSISSRCDFKESLIKKGCKIQFIESPQSRILIERNFPLSNKGSGSSQSDVIQLMPQKIALNLRPDHKTTFHMQVRQVEDYPVDLYYLMDLSLSMKDDLDNIRVLGTTLSREMAKLTSNFRLGFGTFVDKPTSPFSYTGPKYQNNPCVGYKLFPQCVPSFGFRHLLSLTDKSDKFNAEVQKQMVSRNRDAPEGGFDAILQAAVCKDYPSLALLGEKLAENNIHLIFAVTQSHYILYKNFTALIPGTTVEILDKDSKNIIQLIVNAYSSIRSKVELTVGEQPEDIDLSLTATCQDGISRPGVRKCGDLKIGDTVSFDVTVEARSCPETQTRNIFTIKPVGFKDSLSITVGYICNCDCTSEMQTNSSKCNGNGTYECGICKCDPGFLGANCECQDGETNNVFQTFCREAEGKPICSGRGECSCNQCVCYESEFGRIYGTFCECDDFSCARHKGILCSGHGECHCGECKCHASWIGDNCNCSTEMDSCLSDDGQICSGRGNCACGRCSCTEPGAFGDTCEKCPTCPDACGTKRECIECRLFNSGRLADNQTCQKLCKDEILTVDVLKTDDQDAVLCLYKTENDCVMRFTYSEHVSGKSILTALKEPECASETDPVTVLLAVVGSILAVGIALLAIWKLIVTIHDRREFARFQNERSRARYEMATNPLYRQPITTHTVEILSTVHNKSYNGIVD